MLATTLPLRGREESRGGEVQLILTLTFFLILILILTLNLEKVDLDS